MDATRRLSTTKLTAVYTGPLRRTIATAQIIADEARVPDIRILHGLVNLDYGDWEGMTVEEAEVFDPASFKLYRTKPEQAICPSGERLRDATDRMLQAMQLIGSRHQGEDVAAVSHAVMIRLAVARINSIVGETWRAPVGRGSLTAFTVAVDGTIALVHAPSGGIPDSAPSSG
jgi:broad specificity phosphatase PhoE